jgi:hypothetical protein
MSPQRVYVLLCDWANYNEEMVMEFVGVYATMPPLIAKLEELAARHNLGNLDFSYIETEALGLKANEFSNYIIDLQSRQKFDWVYKYYIQCCLAV